MPLTEEQERVLQNNLKNLVISASAGSGKTFVMIEKLCQLICEKNIPVDRLLVLTFTNAGANEMKNRLYNAILSKKATPFLIEQLDSLPLADISTIDAFCEKIVKRNVNKLEIDENFAILDEKGSKKLKMLAFERTYQYFAQNENDDFDQIYFAFKKNKNSISECIFDLEKFFDSEEDEKILLCDFEKNISSYHQKACDYLLHYLTGLINEAKELIWQIDLKEISANEQKIFDCYNSIILNIDTKIKDFFEFANSMPDSSMLLPLKGKLQEDNKEFYKQIKKNLSEVISFTQIFKNLENKNENFNADCEEGKLIKAILKMYSHYIKLYSSLKEKRSSLDFADLEKMAKTLMQDEDIKKSLQEKYDYIFIDEYQDTNRLQKSIIMPIAYGGHFVAVGDIKQGIYGFRNANMEIMLEDIENFAGKENSDALFLRGNFRTDEHILSFVNQIFEKIMTLESVGIDYKKTSLLKGLKHFERDNLPPVSIDVVCNKTNEGNGEKEIAKQDDNKTEKIYSVKDDILCGDNRFQEEVLTIYARIQEVLLSEIYDAKLEKFRQVTYSDIAILFRGRSALMKELLAFLRKEKLPVNADIKENLLEDSQVALIYSLIKLTLNFNDDIALATVMMSPFGGFSLDELAILRANIKNENTLLGKDINFYEIVSKCQNKKVLAFKEMIETFKFDTQIHGLIKSLHRLFDRYNYYEFLSSLDDYSEKVANINSLFKLIRNGDYDFNLPALITHLNTLSAQGTSGEGGGNAIALTTIHATKGLEYPIVFLCGCGETLSKAYNKSYIVSKKIGLATYINDFENMIRLPSPSFLAGKMSLKNREFVDEIMIFYVAMTRAQNHLYIIGSGNVKDFSFKKLKEQNSYLKFIFFALGENFTSQFFEQGQIITENYRFNFIEEIKEVEEDIEENKELKMEQNNKFACEIEKYNNFIYPQKDECRLSYKNSVTGSLKLSEDEGFVNEFQEEDNIGKVDEKNKNIREIAIMKGNSYHEALKLIDFDLISSREDLEKLKPFLKDKMTEGYFPLIDFDLLYDNIILIKNIVGKDKVYKEREFIMECSLDEINPIKEENNLSLSQNNNKVIVQGIIDCFSMGEKLILIDYKFSSIKNDAVLLQRYNKQLDLYEKALYKAFNKKIDEKYILSLKQAKMIIVK